jgi:hypothetical protein
VRRVDATLSVDAVAKAVWEIVGPHLP